MSDSRYFGGQLPSLTEGLMVKIFGYFNPYELMQVRRGKFSDHFFSLPCLRMCFYSVITGHPPPIRSAIGMIMKSDAQLIVRLW